MTELRGERVLLRSMRESDLDDLEALFSEPDVAPWWPNETRETLRAGDRATPRGERHGHRQVGVGDGRVSRP